MEIVAQPTSWICRTCGVSNTVGRGACRECGEPPAAARSRGMLAQVLNPGAEIVHNHVYNFAAEATVITPQELERADRALDRWTAEEASAPAPRRDLVRSFVMAGVGVATWLSVLIVASVFAFFIGVVWVAFTRVHG